MIRGTSDFIASLNAIDINNNKICNSDRTANLNTWSIITSIIIWIWGCL